MMTTKSKYNTITDLYRFLNTSNEMFMKSAGKLYGKVTALLACWFAFEFAGFIFLASWSIQWVLVSTTVAWIFFWSLLAIGSCVMLMYTIYKISLARLALRIHMMRALRNYIKKNRYAITKEVTARYGK